MWCQKAWDGVLVMLAPIQLSKMPTSKGAQGERWYLLTRPHFCFPVRPKTHYSDFMFVALLRNMLCRTSLFIEKPIIGFHFLAFMKIHNTHTPNFITFNLSQLQQQTNILLLQFLYVIITTNSVMVNITVAIFILISFTSPTSSSLLYYLLPLPFPL